MSAFHTIRWEGDAVVLIDQRALPADERYVRCATWPEVADAIRSMVVRGAPAIGITAAYGMVLAARAGADLAEARAGLAATRPTAVNLFWALDRMYACAAGGAEGLLDEAHTIAAEDLAMCEAMGAHGAALLPTGTRILTHCNTGALATGGHGTALGVIRTAWAEGRLDAVYADETRPFLQGSRLTAWELHRDAIPVKVIVEGMAAHFMARGEVSAVIVGTDRVAANGDVANKIGTYGLAVLCRHHDIPFYVAGPTSTVDLATATGADIPIEQRDPREVTHVGERQLVPDGVAVCNPAFDVTPADLVTAIITEAGVARAPYAQALRAHVEAGSKSR